VMANNTFSLIKENAARIKQQENDKVYSLNEKLYKEELDEANETAEKMEALQKEASKLTVSNPSEDMQKINIDSTTIEKNEKWLSMLKKDIYIAETVNII